MSLPQWTSEIIEVTKVGEDQLGVEGAAQGYQQLILPGITTVTDHARYYSLYAWIIYRYLFDRKSSRLLAGFRGQFYSHHEVALILSAFLHHLDRPISGVTGSGINNRTVKRLWGKKDPTSLDQDYFQNKEGGFGQYYRIAMQTMGIIEIPEDNRLVYYLTDRGKDLAEAYQESISDTQYYKSLEECGQLKSLSREDASEYGEVGCICPEALSRGKDRIKLLDAFFRMDEPQGFSNNHVRRRNSLGVVLDLVHQADGQFRRERLRPALYIREFSAGLNYSPANEIVDWVKRWQLVEVRHMYSFGFQCLWAAFLLELRDHSEIGRDEWQAWITSQLKEKGWDISLKKLSEKLCAKAGISGKFDELLEKTHQVFGLQSGLDEYSLYQKAIRRQTNSAFLFQTGVCILLQIYLRFFPDYKSQDPLWLEIATRDRLPMNRYFTNVERKLQNTDFSTFDWVNWVFQEYIFEQHEMVALEKLRNQWYDTFKFYYDEGIFRWPTGKNGYTEPIRLAANRLNNCITILEDLGLLIENPDGFLSLSADGISYYHQVLKALEDAN